MRLGLADFSRARVVFALSLLLLCAAARAQAQQAAPALAAEKVKQVEALVNAEMARQKIPGMSVALVVGGQLRWSNGYGLSDVENNVPAKASTVYRPSRNTARPSPRSSGR
jgi:CubicO group peptidase (beta-lactamase class C family)